MASTVIDIERIDGTPRTVRELFTARKYGLDYYQREYNWTEFNVTELLDDLSTRFLDEYDPNHERQDVAGYRPYFLGPIVTSNRAGVLYLVDGQQRLTTLTLLLLHLMHLHGDEAARADLASLVYAVKYGRETFNLDIEERGPVMRAILEGRPFDPEGAPDSVRTLWQRYLDIERLFPEELKEAALPYFVDWLLERVVVVEIATSDSDLALEIFETMNDRGLRLSATDMLKGYLLSSIRDPAEIRRANDLWRHRVTELSDTERNADADFFKHWLRAKYATTIRERRKDAVAGDFDVIGTAFHKWIRDNREAIGLRKPGDFATFVNRDLERLSSRFRQLLEASTSYRPGFEHVFYNAATGFTTQYQTILAAVTPVDDDETFRLKVRMVAGFLDRFVALRILNYRNFGYSTVSYTMFNLAKDIRDLDIDELADVLGKRCAALEETFDDVRTFALHQRNGGHVRYILARLTAWVDERCGTGLPFPEYWRRDHKKPFEIEHIWANHYDRHVDEFKSEQDFAATRDRLGDLLLVPKDFNASYGDMPYEAKLPHYLSQNLLARSLHPQCYVNNPSFLNLIEETGLPFEPHREWFTSNAIEQRQELYRQLCEQVWDPKTLGLNVPDSVPVTRDAPASNVKQYGVTIPDLIDSGLLSPGMRLTAEHTGSSYTAAITRDGKVQLPNGDVFDTPSGAAMAALNRQSWNGWAWWRAETSAGRVRLSRLREEHIERQARR